MNKFLLISCFIVFPMFATTATAQKMDNKKIAKLLGGVADSINGQTGYWQFKYFDRYFILITDETNNRMRIMSPIANEADLDDVYFKKALEANYHSALDVKYALAENIMWSVFIHPLKALNDDQLLDAISQVYAAAATFGYSYSSTNFVFGKPQE
ncbi:MAG: hypothetical protein CVT95_05015 [Bacteroidetes bacterium HGW-Bacteroidetes-12]|nr:MAG: hypothetical protein CVT95_05015 [Bacteroidetes bacterium HGW-Bacteroidetes-12]